MRTACLLSLLCLLLTPALAAAPLQTFTVKDYLGA